MNVDYVNLMEQFYDINNFLEMCRGYAQSDTPDMKALSESLYILECRYRSLYKRLQERDYARPDEKKV